MANATDPTVQTAPAAVPANLAGTDHPAMPVTRSGVLALVAETMQELGIDAVDAGCPVSVMLATPELAAAMLDATRLHEAARAEATLRARFSALYSCGL